MSSEKKNGCILSTILNCVTSLEYDLHSYATKKSEDQKVIDLNGIKNNIKEIRPTVPVSLKKANSINDYVKDQAYSWTVTGKKDLIFQVVIVINYNRNLFLDEGCD